MTAAVGALIGALLNEPDGPARGGDLRVTLASRLLARSCSIESTATIVAYDANAAHEIVYRFVRSDGSSSPDARIDLSGDGAVAQSVRDRWTPHAHASWVMLEILAPQHVRTPRVAITSRCAHRVVAKR
jgi:hypothetical protein